MGITKLCDDAFSAFPLRLFYSFFSLHFFSRINYKAKAFLWSSVEYSQIDCFYFRNMLWVLWIEQHWPTTTQSVLYVNRITIVFGGCVLNTLTHTLTDSVRSMWLRSISSGIRFYCDDFPLFRHTITLLAFALCERRTRDFMFDSSLTRTVRHHHHNHNAFKNRTTFSLLRAEWDKRKLYLYKLW